jgi:GntR family transcriptional repressor for pyruvate dehydrogenase complex
MMERPSSSSAPALDAIYDLVRRRKLRVGDQLPSIRELADQLDLKRTVVRDALLKAESLGFVRVLPRAGAFLQCLPPATTAGQGSDNLVEQSIEQMLTTDDHNLFHLLDARRLVEVELAGRAAQQRRLEDLLPVRRALEAILQLPAEASRGDYVERDIRFHVEIARLAGNQVLFAVQRSLMELLRPHLNDVREDLQRRETTDRSHLAIYEALVAGDAPRARQEMCDHLSLAYDGMLRDIQELSDLEGIATSRRCQ